MMENRKTLDATDLDGFDKRKLPSPGFQVEVVMIDYDGTLPPKLKAGTANKGSDGSSVSSTAPSSRVAADSNHAKASVAEDNDDVFSDSDGEDNGASNRRQTRAASRMESAAHASDNRAQTLVHGTEKLSIKSEETRANNASKDPVTKGTGTGTGTGKAASGIGISNSDSIGASDFKAIAADASVFSFGDDEDFESE